MANRNKNNFFANLLAETKKLLYNQNTNSNNIVTNLVEGGECHVQEHT